MLVPLTVADFLDRAEAVAADRTAVVDEPLQPATPVPTTTYGQLLRRVRAWQAGLDALGVGVGERVAVVSHNSARLLELLYAVPASGRVCVPVNFRLRPEEISYIIDHCDASVVLVDPELETPAAALGAAGGPKRFVLGEQTDTEVMRFDTEPRPWSCPDENATATLNYTSGTSARPKGVALTHRNIWLNAMTFGVHGRIWEGDVYLHTLPAFHCNGWGVPFLLAGLGAKQVMLRRIDGTEILRRVAEHGVTLAFGAPAVWDAVLAAARRWEGPIPGSGRVRVVCAGAPVRDDLVARVENELGWEFHQVYGLTETTLLTFNRRLPEGPAVPAPDTVGGLTRAGGPALGVRLRVSSRGEVLARSNMMLDRYWRDEEASAKALSSGWFHTGDVGSLDDEGHLVLFDRMKDVIVTGGESVSSVEVEDCLLGHPAVAEAAVIGVPDDRWGETVKAVVVTAEGARVSEADLIAHCKRRLAGYKAPTSVDFRATLPRTSNGKVQKYRLREPYWVNQDRRIN
ncbi:Acyl-CoA synthetase (AMP-forming)/AMP-acid ligase II [Streptoalloteichus tenebrarius]|uniref:Acyl-CoA synthetase (AMP-forming)/AMP-acid ligase II n=1 Tax=Streptoalloteichus tenebrarius (strain ATCC 17920 / DSM 40477 / JCM 4838 / CBS 697.72 / NBRC 16177 / NCIMB 11028 / NRRL B-12390 / A12253. 1 / ISP 5477) TaxID=1933 RepID=A0ABT1HTN1_STRSD|nr:AMP-binding protein [Streptoalloteichus tenebrarius]MCP2258867.1 Acyl-CoA synthetase (AMP-forming)/AMP-acid ligase II [Streptoalloteichus tenebrarius]BFE99449.1 AMP-binding protein [Streptoalloteichus tenebrarius]